MQINFTENADGQLKAFVKSGNKGVLKKVLELVSAIERNPFEGIGKPERLKHELSGLWSRRIDKEHRLVYEIVDNIILIHS